LSRIYTRTGDDGSTGLTGGQRLPKDALRIEAYGTIDELNSALGVVLAAGLDEALVQALSRVQSELFDLGAALAAFEADRRRLRIAPFPEETIATLETTIDRLSAELPPLKTFILPGGTPGASHLHVARTVCRRAERRVVALRRQAESDPGAGIGDTAAVAVRYLNRLADLLFVAARYENWTRGVEDVPWTPRRETLPESP
jgi:cob(I)alamin adenosyltransferase